MFRRKAPASCQEDGDWFVLTEGMDPYERFRFIARHVLRSAIRDVAHYATDPRLFEAAEDPARRCGHLRGLDHALGRDEDLTPTEQAFLCDVLVKAMEDLDVDPSCLFTALRDHAVRTAPREDR